MKQVGRSAMVVALAAVLSACGDEDLDTATEGDTVGAESIRLAAASDESWINLEGTVESKTPSSFVLDYGAGNVTVEMDDWDWFQEGGALKVGDRISVTGRIDRDLLDRARIEASSVFVHGLGTYFYASGTDEEDVSDSSIYMIAPPGAVDATGFVTAIEGTEFSIGTAGGAMRVETAGMSDNPLDDQGSPRLRVTDRVYVWGSLDVDAREPDELMADGVVLLKPDRTRRADAASSGTSSDAAGNRQDVAVGNAASAGSAGSTP